jgi:hypothetical protein
MQGAQNLRSEAYAPARRNDEGEVQQMDFLRGHQNLCRMIAPLSADSAKRE